jgi:hypothetical protein
MVPNSKLWESLGLGRKMDFGCKHHNYKLLHITLNNILLPNLKRWGKEKIESIFPLDITNRILKVVDNDQLVWYYDNHGCYSVKSGYNLLIKLTGRGEVLTARRIGIQYGKFMHLQKLNISFGEFVKDVCRPVAA